MRKFQYFVIIVYYITELKMLQSLSLFPNWILLNVKVFCHFYITEVNECFRYHQEVEDAAKGFIALGLEPSHAVGIMASNSPEWWEQKSASHALYFSELNSTSLIWSTVH